MVGETVIPVPGEWTKVALTIPSEATFPLKRIEIRFLGNRAPGPVYIDDVAIGPNYSYSFEDGSVTPWGKKKNGIIDVRVSTEHSHSGARSMEVVFSNEGPRRFLQLAGLTDVSAGDELTFYVYTPDPEPVQESLGAGTPQTSAERGFP